MIVNSFQISETLQLTPIADEVDYVALLCRENLLLTLRRLDMLTILSAIFMPITLLAGIWGMNFEIMPELKYPFAYPIALGVMVLVGAARYRFFRRTGWFD